MVHFKPKVPNTWGKSFLTSVMGTTISILLTFGTSALVERIEIVVSRDKKGDVNSHYLKRVKEK